MKKIHIAIGVADIARSIEDYSRRFGCAPCAVVPGKYALWRTDGVNFSIRRVDAQEVGKLRHLGWEVADASGFSKETDVNGVVWERFCADAQQREIEELR